MTLDPTGKHQQRVAQRILLLAGLALAVVVFAQSTSYRWPLPYSPPDAGAPIPFYTWSGAGAASGISQTTINSETAAAFATWTSVSCLDGGFAFAKFASAGTSGAVDSNDALSVGAIFVNSSTDPYYQFALGGGQSVAGAVPLSYGGAVFACDIFLNRYDFAFSAATPTPADNYDFRTVMLYEIGKCLGLDDNYTNSNAAMSISTATGRHIRALDPDDVEEICAAYPNRGYGSPCANDTNCNTAAGLHCIASNLSDGGQSSSYCTTGCSYVAGSANSCAAPFLCQPVTGVKRPAAQPFTTSGACLINGNAVTQVGKACNIATDCGGPSSICLPSSQLPSNYEAWHQGYCTQDCTTEACPSGSACYSINGSQRRCLKLCRGDSDCRADYQSTTGPFYACSPLQGLDAGFGACVNACHSDDDCGGAYCRTCDGVCIPRQKPASEIGDPCALPSDCGIGQVCLKFGTTGSQGVCSAPCGTACSSCPSGASCYPLGAQNQSYCLKDCTDSTCGAAQQCAYLATSAKRGCEPQCLRDSDCLNGFRCSFNQCSPAQTDGGSCDLCFVAPTTAPPGSNGTDAGVHPVTGGGCGCNTGAGVLSAPLLWMLFSLGARRRWSNRRP